MVVAQESAGVASGRISNVIRVVGMKGMAMSKAVHQLTTRVSEETRSKFDEQRKEMGLSTNQFLKFLVLAAQEKVDEFIREQGPMPARGEDLDSVERQRLIEWLRGK